MSTTSIITQLKEAGWVRVAVWLPGWEPRFQVFDLESGVVSGFKLPVYGSLNSVRVFSTPIDQYDWDRYPAVAEALVSALEHPHRYRPRNALMLPRTVAERRRRRESYELPASVQLIHPDVKYVRVSE